MDRSEASALADLQMHWDEAYEIGLDGAIWRATFRGTADELRAHTSSELRDLIRADYAYRQRQHRDGDACPDAYSDAYEGDFRGDEPGADDTLPRRPNFADIRGERMST